MQLLQLTMDKWRGKVAVVTGASSGIGAAVARSLVHHGMVVVGLARRDDRIKQLSEELAAAKEPGQLHAIRADVCKEEDLLSAFDWVDRELGGVDVLVNNAGYWSHVGIDDGTVELWNKILNTNVIGSSICSREYLKSVEKHKKEVGHIFVVNSVVGHIVMVDSPMYCASKHALRALSMCLRRKLADQQSKIKDICPGLTKTEILDNTTRQDMFDHMSCLASEDVAAVIVDCLSASSVTQICEVVMNPVPTSIAAY
ncbi:farnesol dehydrogenase-like isoform X2 [Homalodisca vitripennis]|uniref:farnesol dehydrogenase-like isoform X2 n=1 Tax=Homalodisca vitripennis TaxID=197043 RepID=UPI001EEB4ED6|nr:farnesol dehydrogenase-like isoform X2 [Homalodisca vitripennis]